MNQPIDARVIADGAATSGQCGHGEDGTTKSATRSALKRLLASELDADEVSLIAVAMTLSLTPRTLQRRLRLEGVTFERVLDDVRKEKALKLLDEGRLSITEIGYCLGYSYPGGFSRAFRRWTGRSPLRFLLRDRR